MSYDGRGWLESFLAAMGRHAAAAPQAAPLSVAPVLAAVPRAPDGGLVTGRLLLRLGAKDADAWAGPISSACAANGIDTPMRVAGFLPNILHETAGFSAMVENLDYTPQSLLKQWPSHFTAASAARLGRTPAHPADQRGIAEAAYGGRLGNGKAGSGDGWLYRGRGLMQLTGRDNYARFAARIGVPLADLPALLETHQGAADSAAAYWRVTGCNAPADRGNIDGVRRIINGGSIGLEDVRTRYAAARHALGC